MNLNLSKIPKSLYLVLVILVILIVTIGIILLLEMNAPANNKGEIPATRRADSVGGDCQYKKYHGCAKIVSVSLTRPVGYSDDRYEVEFTFTPDQKVQEPFAKTEGRDFLLLLNNGSYPKLTFIEKYNIKVGKTLDSTLAVIVKGTCTPTYFDFPFITPEDIKENQ